MDEFLGVLVRAAWLGYANVKVKLLIRAAPGENKAVEVDPLLLGDPCGPVQPLSRFQHLAVQPLDQLLLRCRVQPLLLQVVGQSVDVWLHHFHQLSQGGDADHWVRRDK